ncbi:hypothetical protein G7Y89_g3234 [Cudoniella acicularis]|uniref:Uncharacterized protein n=1 Tax=Cudoniella acicularis TaxID=354080 RepID=A0A8H4W658_9HELO|nr:hypothetical protein G7Y89_g3234 [Cudoniella acicularis]
MWYTGLAITFGVITTVTGLVGLILKYLEWRRSHQQPETLTHDVELGNGLLHRHHHYHLIAPTNSFNNPMDTTEGENHRDIGGLSDSEQDID